MIAMFSLLIILPVSFIPLYKKQKGREVLAYMAGENTGDNLHFNGSLGETQKSSFSNWYMKDIFGDMGFYGNFICVASMIAAVGLLVAEVLR
jgi:ech hydrogenase subunit A